MNSWPIFLVDLLILLTLIRLLDLILIQRELKPISLTLSVALSLTSSIILFQYYLYFCANLVQFDTNIVKINFAMIYLTRVA